MTIGEDDGLDLNRVAHYPPNRKPAAVDLGRDAFDDDAFPPLVVAPCSQRARRVPFT